MPNNYSKYRSYIKSASWKRKKAAFRKSNYCKRKCYICGSNKYKIHIHHKTYKDLGNEKFGQLVELCTTTGNRVGCHELLHTALKNKKNTKSFNLWNAHVKMKKVAIKHGRRGLVSWSNRKDSVRKRFSLFGRGL